MESNCRGYDPDRPGVLSCRYSDDDDVVGHGLEQLRSATVTISWTEDENGVRQLDIRADDPDAVRILMGAIDPGSHERSIAATVAD